MHFKIWHFQPLCDLSRTGLKIYAKANVVFRPLLRAFKKIVNLFNAWW